MTGEASQRTRAGSSIRGLAGSCALLALVIAVAAIGIATIRAGGWSQEALTDAAVAAMICWAAGALALTATFLGNLCKLPVQGVLVGMFFRMGLPLAAIVALGQIDEPLARSGATMTILGVYLVALVSETLLALRLVPRPAHTLST